MPNTREKLIDLLQQGREMANELCGKQDGCEKCPYQAPKGCAFGFIADHLIANGVTVQEWISIEAGELQNYIGVPVCIKRKTDGECWWAIIRGIKGDKVSTDYGGYFKLSEYGEIWMVKYFPLPQPPKGAMDDDL